MRLINGDALRAWFESHSVYDEFSVGYIMGLIDEQPTVDAVPVVHGRWTSVKFLIGIESLRCSESLWCSVCNYETKIAYNYCPYCGARMDDNG